MERLFVGKVYKALQSQIKGFTANVRANGVDYAASRMSTTLMNEDIGPVIQQLYRIGAVTNANNVYSNLKRYEPKEKLAGFGFNDVWTKDVNRYFQMHLLEKAVLPISETTKKQILSLLKTATEEGWSVEQVVKELEGSDITKSRARMIVRTESVRATNFGGMLGAFESRLVMEKQWIAAHDFRTRGNNPNDKHSHISLDKDQTDLLKPFYDSRSGEAIMFPGDPEASAGNVINCFLPDQLTNVNWNIVKHAFRNRYKGKIVTVQTSGGQTFACTPNHPILTTSGWVNAGELTSAHKLVKSCFLKLDSEINLNVNNTPSSFEQIFNSLLSSNHSVRVSKSIVNFHGDIPASDVDIVSSNRFLRDSGKPVFFKVLSNNILKYANLRKCFGLSDSTFCMATYKKFRRQVSNGFVSLTSHFFSFINRSLSHPDEHRLASIPFGYTSMFKPTGNNVSANLKPTSKPFNTYSGVEKRDDFFNRHIVARGIISGGDSGGVNGISDVIYVNAGTISDLLHSHSGFVKSDSVLNVNVTHYEGLVYTLETHNQMYDINSYISRNCRCTLGFVPKRDKNGRLIRKPEQNQNSSIRTSLVDVLSGLLVGVNLINELINDN